eukprot:jgi/Pico_ML_1/54983/g111.t1
MARATAPSSCFRANRTNGAGRTAVNKIMCASYSEKTGVVFEPFTEVKGELATVEKTVSTSLARQAFDTRCEDALNEQINIEYNVSYIYHALWAYFDRDYVALPGLAAFFKSSSEEERGHAEGLMTYQNLRGGKVKLNSIMLPQMEFSSEAKGDALYAMELTLSLEKLNNEKLLSLHKVADECGDVQMCDFIESNYLEEQVTP